METINHEYYVSLEVAKLLKEAGFDWECTHYYSVNTLHEPNNGFIHIYKQYEALFYDHNRTKMPVYSAPTLEVAQRWLREVKNIDVFAYRNEPKDKFESIVSFNKKWSTTGMCINTYEEALETSIKKALEIIIKGE